MDLIQLSNKLDGLIEFKINIDPKNKGKFTATQKRSGKSAEELKNSKNPLTRKRANFAITASKWKHKGRKSRAGGLSSAIDDIIAFKAIDLGRTYEDYACTAGDSPSPSKKSYPSLYVSGRDEEIKLPIEGKAIVRYKLRGKSMNQDETGKKKHSADIEIHNIDPIAEDDKPKEGGKAKLLGLSVPQWKGPGIDPRYIAKARKAYESAVTKHGVKVGATIGGSAGAGAAGAAIIQDRRFKKKKTDQGGMVPGDCPGSTSALSARLDTIIAFGDVPLRPITDALKKEIKDYRPNILRRTTLKVKPKGWYSTRSSDVAQGLSSRLDKIINFGDPRPRNPLGEFAGNNQEGAADPNSMDLVYRQGQHKGIAEGGAASAAGFGSGVAIKALLSKLKKAKA